MQLRERPYKLGRKFGDVRGAKRIVLYKGIIAAFPVITANRAIDNGDKQMIIVDGDRCIACGACFDACEHHAREYRDDTELFFEALKRGERISVLWAPAFAANYPREYKQILGGLKRMGVNRVISVSFGADITTWGYIKYITEHNFKGGISQPCPGIVNYIEHYIPELIPKLVPIQSPLMCAAIYAKKYLNITDKLAFISPCIAKKDEIADPQNKGYISYNVTFDHLMEYARRNHIKAEPAKVELEYGLGSIYPMPGGLKENVYWFCGEEVFIRQIEGERHAYDFLEDYKKRVLGGRELPFMVDALNCAKGCIYGTGVEEEKTKNDDILYELQRIKEASKKHSGAWARGASPAHRLRNLNKQFAHLDIRDFIREYTDKSKGCKLPVPNESQLTEIYQSMQKKTKQQQEINCSACGYDTCREMAEAIFNGCNKKDNCVHYMKDMVELEKEQVQEISDQIAFTNAEITKKSETISTMVAEANEEFRTLNLSIDEMVSGNNSKAGERTIGKGLAVVAQEIKNLSEVSRGAADDSNKNKAMISEAIDLLATDSEKLIRVVDSVNDRINNLAASTEEIAASATVIGQVANELRGKFEKINEL